VGNFISRGVTRRRQVPEELADRVPPGQYIESGFPVLTAGPTPRVDTGEWSLKIDGMVAQPREWNWTQFHQLPQEDVPCDIHCVTKWSKLGTSFGGVSLDTLLEDVDPRGAYTMVHSYGGYTTNLPLADLLDGQALVAFRYEGEELDPEHGGPARLLVPHLYLWKSAKWVRGITLMHEDEPGFWESVGYHNYGDPWREQRYWDE
jgi:DMSO/TMAO reductase YedYZ molybdopterin-dependent catalytic subunit